MKRKIITFIIIVICFLLECTIFHRLSFASIKPNLLIIVTSSFGFMRGKKEGMAVGFVSGLLVDIFWGSALGFYLWAGDVFLPVHASGKFRFYQLSDTYHSAGTGIYHSDNIGSVSDHITHQQETGSRRTKECKQICIVYGTGSNPEYMKL